MRRRTAWILTLTLSLLWGPLAAEAQPGGKMPRIGVLAPGTPAVSHPSLDAFRQGLRALGWAEGQNIAFEYRFAEGQLDRLPHLAAELVRLKVDVILAGSTRGALAAKHATGTIPIAMVIAGEPVASGLVASLARPGGNLTGVTALGQALSGKRLELLKEAVPGITRVAVLANVGYPDTEPFLTEVEGAARALGVQLRVLEVRDPSELEQAFAALSSERAGALMVGPDPMFGSNRRRIVELAATWRVPTMYSLWEFVDAGGIMFYGAPLPHMYRRVATFVDKILKGTKPADLPVEQPTKFELVINLKTAQALGLTLPSSVLFQATEVIQ
jgi:putative ABC transport system substrate-binding protein